MSEDLRQFGSWSGENVTMGQVLSALDDLRRGEERAASRTSVVNLVVVAPDDARAARATNAIHGMGGRHPGRSVTVVCRGTGQDDEPGGLDADVALHGSLADGHRVWSEDVRLGVRGPLSHHLDSLVEPLTLPDLPVVVWFTGHPPTLDEPLLQAADAVVVDTKEPAAEQLAAVSTLAQRHTVVDLAWIRLHPWRNLLAGLFEPTALRPFVTGITSATVSGKPGARLLLGGWLVSRLSLAPSAITLADGRHASMSLTGECGGERAEFRVWRSEGDRVVNARASTVEGGEPGNIRADDRMALPDDAMSWSLAEALTHLRRDRVHAAALQAALAL